MAARGGGLMLSASTSVDLVLFEAIARTHFTEGRGNPNLLVGNRQITFYGESLDASLVLHAGARLDDGSARHLLQAFLPQSHSGICASTSVRSLRRAAGIQFTSTPGRRAILASA